jgi:hypothetical protein
MHWRSAALLLVCIGFVSAQTTAIVRGDVADAQGSPAVGAVVRLENVLTGFSRQVTAEDDGSFQITNIPLQTYVITAFEGRIRALFAANLASYECPAGGQDPSRTCNSVDSCGGDRH